MDNRISENQDLIHMCLFVLIRGLEVLTLFEKTKPINRALPGNPKHEIRNPNELDRCCLKKQSQFLKGQNDVNSLGKGAYEDFLSFGTAKNKAKQTQFIRAECCVLCSAGIKLKKQSQFLRAECCVLRSALWN